MTMILLELRRYAEDYRLTDDQRSLEPHFLDERLAENLGSLAIAEYLEPTLLTGEQQTQPNLIDYVCHVMRCLAKDVTTDCMLN